MSTRKAKDELLAPAEYVARVRLSGPDNETLADPGETCEKVPEASLPWLVRQKLIERKGRVQMEDEAAANG